MKVNHTHVGEAINEEEKIDSTREHREPGTARLPGDESLTEVENATNPEELTSNKYHDNDSQGHSDEYELVGVDERIGTKSKAQRESEDALIN